MMRTVIRLGLAMLTVLAVTHYVQAQRARWEPPAVKMCAAQVELQKLLKSSR
jgi:hypothetical protein